MAKKDRQLLFNFKGRIFINVNENHKALKELSKEHGIPMGVLARDLIVLGIERIQSGEDKINTNQTRIQIT